MDRKEWNFVSTGNQVLHEDCALNCPLQKLQMITDDHSITYSFGLQYACNEGRSLEVDSGQGSSYLWPCGLWDLARRQREPKTARLELQTLISTSVSRLCFVGDRFRNCACVATFSWSSQQVPSNYERGGAMQAARSSSLRALHAALLQHLRVPPAQPGAAWGLFRAMSGEAHAQGTYLDRSQVVDRVLSVLKTNPKVDPVKVSETASFQGDLGLDSLDEVEIVMAIEEEFALEIPDADADKIKSTRDVIEYVATHPRAK